MPTRKAEIGQSSSALKIRRIHSGFLSSASPFNTVWFQGHLSHSYCQQWQLRFLQSSAKKHSPEPPWEEEPRHTALIALRRETHLSRGTQLSEAIVK